MMSSMVRHVSVERVEPDRPARRPEIATRDPDVEQPGPAIPRVHRVLDPRGLRLMTDGCRQPGRRSLPLGVIGRALRCESSRGAETSQ